MISWQALTGLLACVLLVREEGGGVEAAGGEEEGDRRLEAKRREVSEDRRAVVLHRRVVKERPTRLQAQQLDELGAAEGFPRNHDQHAELALTAVDCEDVQPVLALEQALAVRLQQELRPLLQDGDGEG